MYASRCPPFALLGIGERVGPSTHSQHELIFAPTFHQLTIPFHVSLKKNPIRRVRDRKDFRCPCTDVREIGESACFVRARHRVTLSCACVQVMTMVFSL